MDKTCLGRGRAGSHVGFFASPAPPFPPPPPLSSSSSVRTLGGTTTFYSGKNGISTTDVSGPVNDLGNSFMDAPINQRNPKSKIFGSSTSLSANLSFEDPTDHNTETRDNVSSNISCSFANLNIGNCDSGTFPIATGVAMSSSLECSSDLSDDGSFSRLPDELGKLKLHGSSNGYASVNAKHSDSRSELHDDGNKFDFVSCKDPSSFANGFGSIKSESAGFVPGPVNDLGNSFTDAPINSRNPKSKSFGSSTSHSANLSFEDPTEHNTETRDNVSSNISCSFVNLNIGNCDSGTFPIATGVAMSSSLKCSSDVSEDGSFSRLPDELGKLKLHGSSDGRASVNAKHSDNRSELHDDGNKFDFVNSKDPSSFSNGFGSIKSESAGFIPIASSMGNFRKTMDNEDMKRTFTRENKLDDDSGIFIFTTGATVNSTPNQIPSFVSDESIFEKLPDELCKLKLQNLVNKDVLEKAKQSSQSSNGHYVFVCSSNENAPGPLSDTLVDKMSGTTNTLNRGTEQAPQKMKNENGNHPAGAFIFGKSTNKGSTDEMLKASSTIFAKSSSSKFSDDMQRQKSEGSKDEDSSTKQYNNNFAFKFGMNSAPNGFTFGSNVKSYNSIGGSTFYKLSDDMERLNIQSEEGDISRNSERTSDSHLETRDPSEFQTACEEKRIKVDDFCASKMHGCSMPTREHMSSVDSSSFSCASGVMYSEFISSIPISYGLMREGLFTGKNQGEQVNQVESSNMKGGNRTARMKKKRGKLRQNFSLRQNSNAPFASMDRVLENKEPESPGECSPMDYSPYHENLVADQGTREASVASDEAFCTFPLDASNYTQFSAAVKKISVSSSQHLDFGRDVKEHGEANANNSKHHTESKADSRYSEDEKVFTPVMENLVSESSNIYLKSDANITAMQAEASFGSNIETQANDCATFFTFTSSSKGFIGSNSASFSSRGSQSGLKHRHRWKHQMKGGHDSNRSTKNADVPSAFCSSNVIPVANTPIQPNPAQDQASILSGSQNGKYHKSEVNATPETEKCSMTRDAENSAEYGACEKWRLRGNQAYANGDLPKAEDYYTRGIRCISQSETSGSCNRALMLCYSNRAATRMSLGRMREALRDCMMATAIDLRFIRAQVRAANCYLSLGEIEDAVKLFNKCLQSDKSTNVDQKILVEASEGLRKTQQVLDYIVQSEELLQKRTSNEAVIALNSISEAILISPYSERLMETKANALLMLRRYDEVIQFCEQTMEPAKSNHDSNGADVQFGNNLWRWHAIGKAYFYLGKLEEALELLRKHEQLKVKMDDGESPTTLFTTINELLRLKVAGNDAFQAGRHLEAVEHYTAAVACNTESRPFAAICFCNRAAAFQALGQITEAIADCTLAIALDATYPKALSRRATLHEMIRDYGQAANDLHRLLSLLERQYVVKDNHSESLGKSMNNNADVQRARMRLSTIEEEARKDTPLDMYMILGIEPSSFAADVKKAYRKAALRHHPDKAGQLIARSEILDDNLWRQVIDEVHKDADRLFKMIGEAYTILSDPTKRLQYDDEEEMRKFLKKGHTKSNNHRGAQDGYSSQYDRNLNGHRWQTNQSSNWRRYGYSR